MVSDDRLTGNGSAVGATSDESTELLRRGRIGRLGLHADGESYVVPVAYAYVGRKIVARLAPGHKLDMLRAAPDSTCFEVDALDTEGRCHRVVAWGPISELEGLEADRALATLLRRTMTSAAEPLPAAWVDLADVRPGEHASVVALRVLETDLATTP